MSSAKDYVLETTPTPQDADSGLVRFIVRPRPGFLDRFRVPLALAAAAVLAQVLAPDLLRHSGWTRFIHRTKAAWSGQGTGLLWVLLGLQAMPLEPLVWARVWALAVSLVASLAASLIAGALALAHAATSPSHSLFRQLVAGCTSPRAATATGLAGLLAYLLLTRQPCDSMLVIRDVGIQLDSVSRWRFFDRSDKSVFIALKDIIDIVTNEGFHGYGQVVYYMCILRRLGSDHQPVQIVFPHLLPRKHILLPVWKQSRQVLFGTSRRYWRRVPGQGLRECLDEVNLK